VGVSVTTPMPRQGACGRPAASADVPDKELRPGGEILALHDAYRAAAVSADPSTEEETPSGGKQDGTDRGHRVVGRRESSQ
jgi:hypothetical protein